MQPKIATADRFFICFMRVSTFSSAFYLIAQVFISTISA